MCAAPAACSRVQATIRTFKRPAALHAPPSPPARHPNPVCCLPSHLHSQATNRTFKCPYCPAECTPKDCQELVFPDMD